MPTSSQSLIWRTWGSTEVTTLPSTFQNGNRKSTFNQHTLASLSKTRITRSWSDEHFIESLRFNESPSIGEPSGVIKTKFEIPLKFRLPAIIIETDDRTNVTKHKTGILIRSEIPNLSSLELHTNIQNTKIFPKPRITDDMGKPKKRKSKPLPPLGSDVQKRLVTAPGLSDQTSPAKAKPAPKEKSLLESTKEMLNMSHGFSNMDIQNLKSSGIRIYASKEKSEMARMKIQKFYQPPTTHHNTVCFHYPGTVLTHARVRDLVKSRIALVQGAKIVSIQFIPRNVVLGGHSEDNRWIIKVDNKEAMNDLVRLGLVINGAPTVVRVYDNILKEEYKKYVKIQKLMDSTNDDVIRIGNRRILIG